MRLFRSKTALVVMAMLAGTTGSALAEVAVSVNVSAVETTNTGNTISYGWRFYADAEIRITHVGVYDHEGDGLGSEHQLRLWHLPTSGGFAPLTGVIMVGPAGAEAVEDNHVYVELAESVTLVPGERYLFGLWSPSGNQDRTLLTPSSAVSIVSPDWHWDPAGEYHYTSDTTGTDGIVEPWGRTIASHVGLNFKYELPTPVAEAGPDVEIFTAQQSVTVIEGTASDPFPGPDDIMSYRWLEGETVIQDWNDVGDWNDVDQTWAAPLTLGSVPTLSIGAHTLTLELTDGAFTVSDSMTLAVKNTPPVAQPAPTTQAVEIYVDAIIIAAEVSDFDGDELTYEWRKDGEVLDSGTVQTSAGGTAVAIQDLALPARDPRFPLGLNEVELVVNDGVNELVVVTVSVDVQDTRSPTLCPVPSRIILLPPDGQLKPVTIWANVFDRGGGPTTLNCTVESTRPPLPGQTDYYIDSIDNECDIIRLRLRAERRIRGFGRIYKITVTATDQGGNSSSAILLILAPRLMFCR